MNNTISKIKVMQAFVNGMVIEFRAKECPYGAKWETAQRDSNSLSWDWYECDYRIKQNWYDNIKESGCLCWVSDADRPLKKRASVIKKRDKEGVFYGDDKYQAWRYATPLTHDELEVFMSACPE